MRNFDDAGNRNNILRNKILDWAVRGERVEIPKGAEAGETKTDACRLVHLEVGGCSHSHNNLEK